MSALGQQAFWQQAMVAVIVLGALWVAFWRLAPSAWLLRLLDRLQQRLPEAGFLGRRIARRRAKLVASGCGNCTPKGPSSASGKHS